MAYTTLAAVKAYEGIEDSNTDDDDLLNGFITTAQRIIEAPPPIGTGRRFEAEVDTVRRFDAIEDVEGRTLTWFDGDLAAITSITNGNGQAVSSTSYTLIPRTGPPYYGITLRRESDLIWESSDDGPEEAIAITGRWAVAITAPAEIAHLALRIVHWLYRQKGGSVNETPIETPNGIILPASFPPDIRELLAGWRSLV